MSDDKRMAEITNRIKLRRLELGLSFQDLADRTGMSKSTLQRYESGYIRNIPLDKLEDLANALSMDPIQLLGFNSPSPIYEAAAGEARHTEWYSSETYSIKLEADETIVRVVGKSMEPTLQEGDLVIVAAQSVIDHPHQIALVKINGDEATLKRVEVRKDGVLLIGDNIDVYPPHFYSADEVEQLPLEVKGIVTRLIRELE